MRCLVFAPAPSAIYTLSHTTLFRSFLRFLAAQIGGGGLDRVGTLEQPVLRGAIVQRHRFGHLREGDRKSTRLNSSHVASSYAVFCLKKKTLINKLQLQIAARTLIPC